MECFCVVLLDDDFFRKAGIIYLDVISVEKIVVGRMVLGQCVAKRFMNLRPKNLRLVALEKGGTKYIIFFSLYFCGAGAVFLDTAYVFCFVIAVY